MKKDNHKEQLEQNSTVIEPKAEVDEMAPPPNDEILEKEEQKVSTDEELGETSDSLVPNKGNNKRIIVGAIIALLVLIVALIFAVNAFGQADENENSGAIEQEKSEPSNKGELKVKITAPLEYESGSQALAVDVVVYDKDTYSKLEKGEQSNKEAPKPVIDKTIKADAKENLLGEIDPGTYYVSIHPGVLDDGTIFKPVKDYSFEVKKCDHQDLDDSKDKKDHEAACNELVEVTLVVLPVEEMTEESILEAVAHMKEGSEREEAIQRASLKLATYQEQIAAEAAEAERVASEEAAIGDGNGYRDEGGTYVPNQPSGGSSDGSSSGGYSDSGSGGGGSAPQLPAPVWVENWVYSCNVCGYSGTLNDVLAHQDPTAWLNGQTNDPPHGGYSGQDRGYWA